MRMGTVETKTFSMDYMMFGSGTRTLVILPGLSVRSVMRLAEPVTQAYAQLLNDFTIYLFDRRKDLPERYSMQEMAGDTADAIRALGLSHVYVFGASQGGMLGMEIAIRHPDLIEKLAVGATSVRVTDAQFRTISSWIGFAEEKNATALHLAFGEAIYPKEVFEQSRELLREIANSVTEEELEHFVILARSLQGFDISEDIGKITCPVLVLGDRQDHLLGAEASEEIAARLAAKPGCELHLYDGYGHAAYDLAPDYQDRIQRFFLGD